MDNHQGPEPNHNLKPAPANGQEPSPARPAGDRPDDVAAPGIGAWLAMNVRYFALAAAVVGILLYFGLDIPTVVKVGVGLGLVIFIHELGHFLVAKWCDVHVQTFSIGFGPALPGCSCRWGETTYMIALLPLGGYVKMVGEGPDSDEGEDDPRSFKNKPVWQRMAIISAGVTMNVILGFALFVFVYLTHGADRIPAVIDRVGTGTPAWKQGVRPGDVIYQIGSEQGPHLYFQNLMVEVMNSDEGERLSFVYGPPGAPAVHTEIVPVRAEGAEKPAIGIAPPRKLELWPPKEKQIHALPVLYRSAAARATPAFQFGDQIVGSSDPERASWFWGYPVYRVTALPPDPRNPQNPDYFTFEKRLRRLAGQSMVVQVRRYHSSEVVNLHVPPAYHYTLGMRMRMGKITAIRHNSPASQEVQEGDVIVAVEVKAGDRTVCYGSAPKSGPRHGPLSVLPLDPLRLPFELEQWARAAPAGAKKTVTLTLLRKNPPSAEAAKNHNEDSTVVVKLPWQDGWEFNEDMPLAPGSPWALDGLGVCYKVETTVEDVQPGSPAARAGIVRGDVIKKVQFQIAGPTPGSKSRTDSEHNLENDEWATVFSDLQESDLREITLWVERQEQEIPLTAEEDADWPAAERGVWRFLQADTRLQKADNVGEALKMGWQSTWSFIDQVFRNLRSMVKKRISYKLFGGPVQIAATAYRIAGENIYQFLEFLAIISVNLAVINFLPITPLDGGHMVFLVYEGVFRRPAPEKVLTYAMLVGIAMVLSLMLFVTYLDLWGR